MVKPSSRNQSRSCPAFNGRQELRAIGGYYLDGDGKRAEVAFVVHESTHHAGMAGYLLVRLAAIAKQRGLATFWANVLPDNRAMAGLFLAVGGTEAKSQMDEERRFEMSVDKILRSRKSFLERKKIQPIER